jgi:hypothetical protein
VRSEEKAVMHRSFSRLSSHSSLLTPSFSLLTSHSSPSSPLDSRALAAKIRQAKGGVRIASCLSPVFL